MKIVIHNNSEQHGLGQLHGRCSHGFLMLELLIGLLLALSLTHSAFEQIRCALYWRSYSMRYDQVMHELGLYCAAYGQVRNKNIQASVGKPSLVWQSPFVIKEPLDHYSLLELTYDWYDSAHTAHSTELTGGLCQ